MAPVRRSKKKLSFVIQISAPDATKMLSWGDYHYAASLARSLIKLGHNARVQSRADWSTQIHDNEVDIVLRGRATYEKRGNNKTIYWVISGGKKVSQREMKQADHVFVASEFLAETWQKGLDTDKFSQLLQSFDAGKLSAPTAEVARDGICFVGITRRNSRPIIDLALEADAKLKIWGPGWTKTRARDFVMGESIENDDLFKVYQRAEVVLNDQTQIMTRSGLVSNRIFDALACAAPIISTPIQHLPTELAPFVEEVSTSAEFAAAYEKIKNEGAIMKQQRIKFARDIREKHSFDARARTIVEKVDALSTK